MGIERLNNYLETEGIKVDIKKEIYFLLSFFNHKKKFNYSEKNLDIKLDKYLKSLDIKKSELEKFRKNFVEENPELELGYLSYDKKTSEKILESIRKISFWDLIYFDESDKYDEFKKIINYWIDNSKLEGFEGISLVEADKFLFSYPNLIDEIKTSINLYIHDHLKFKIFKLIFSNQNNINIFQVESRAGPDELEYLSDVELFQNNMVWAFPDRSRKFSYDNMNEKYKSSRKEIIALGNILNSMKYKSELKILLPVGFTFVNDTKYMRNSFILKSDEIKLKKVTILPKFKNYSSTNICYVVLEKDKKIKKPYEIILKKIKEQSGNLKIEEKKKIPSDDKTLLDTWRINDFRKGYEFFKEKSEKNKIRISDFALVIRGKNITKKIKSYDKEEGDYLVVNLSDINDGRIEFSDKLQYAIEKKPKALGRYEIEEGDVVIACRGTVLKAGYIPFKKELNGYSKIQVYIDERSKKIILDNDYNLISSVNYLILRVKDKSKFLPKFLTIFFTMSWGKMLLSRIQRGKTVKNINIKDLEALRIPYYTKEKQLNIIRDYEDNVAAYFKAKKKHDEGIIRINKDIKNLDDLRERDDYDKE